jgi:large subunit ribosomal protein L29
MPIVRVKDIVSMSAEDKTNKLYDLRAELARIRTMINAGGAVENPTKVRELRKAIAQILTVQNEERLGIRKTSEPKAEKKAEKPKPVKTKKQPEEKTPK